MMLKSVLVFLLSVLALSSAYISPTTYFAYADLTQSELTTGSTSTVTGTYLILYDASTSSFNYRVISNAPIVGTVTLNGPARCHIPPYNELSFTDSRCIVNTAPVLFTLGQGSVPTSTTSSTGTTSNTQTSYQYFEGTLSFNSVQEAMFFNAELYIDLATQVQTSGTTYVNTPLLRGRIRPYDTVDFPSNSYWMYAYLLFSNDASQFAGATSSKSTSTGFGIISYAPPVPGVNTNIQLWIKIYTTIPNGDTGIYTLQCPSGELRLDNNNDANSNPLNNQVTLSLPTQNNFLTDIWSKECYIFITSATYPTGDLFSGINPISFYEVVATGQKLSPPSQSGYFAYFAIDFDAGTKYMTFYCAHNITINVTSVAVVDSSGNQLCQLANGNGGITCYDLYCYLNQTAVTELTNGNLKLVVETNANPTGEVGGSIVLRGQSTLASSNSGSNSLAIGLGVGLGLGIPLVIGVGVGVYFFMKNNSKGI